MALGRQEQIKLQRGQSMHPTYLITSTTAATGINGAAEAVKARGGASIPHPCQGGIRWFSGCDAR